MKNLLILALGAIVIYGFLYLGNVSVALPFYLYFEIDQGQAVGFYDGFVEYNLYSISFLIFLIPFFFHFFIEKYKRGQAISINALILFFAAIVLSILMGRRAMLLVLLLFIIYFSNKFLGNEGGLKIGFSGYLMFVFCCVFVLAIAFGVQYVTLKEMFIYSFDFSNENGSVFERALQFYALMDGWLKSSFFFGAGNGTAAVILRSEEFPWAYELTYGYWLFSTGVVGILLYFGWYGYGVLRLRSTIRRIPNLIIYVALLLMASISFCIASATNPYFGKFDYLWIVLLPILISGWAKYQNYRY